MGKVRQAHPIATLLHPNHAALLHRHPNLWIKVVGSGDENDCTYTKLLIYLLAMIEQCSRDLLTWQRSNTLDFLSNCLEFIK